MARISLKPVFNAKELSHASKIYIFCQVNIWLDFGINLIAFDSFLYAKGLKKIPYIKTHWKKLIAWVRKKKSEVQKLKGKQNYLNIKTIFCQDDDSCLKFGKIMLASSWILLKLVLFSIISRFQVVKVRKVITVIKTELHGSARSKMFNPLSGSVDLI